jgi:hypothetical protein
MIYGTPFAFTNDRNDGRRSVGRITAGGNQESAGGLEMARLFVCDDEGAITADIEASGPVLRAALEDEQAECVVRCAVLMALSALAEGGDWPTAALESMFDFMTTMKQEICSSRLF